MILATFFPYLQRQYAFSYADINGAWRAHHDLLRASLAYNVAQEAHLLISGATASDGASEDTPMGAALRELRREFGEDRIQLKNGAELPLATTRDDYLFVEKAPGLYRLAHARLAMDATAYPICSLVNSVCFPDLLNSFVGMLIAAEPHDALVVTSEAGLKAVKEGLRQAAEFLKERNTSILSERVPVLKIPLAIEEGLFGSLDRSCCRRILNVPLQSTVLLYVGRFSDEYKADLEPLLLAFRELANADSNLLLFLAGQDIRGQYSNHVEHFADSLGVGRQVKVVVNFPPTVKPVLYSAADIFVSPADNIEETFGLVILEAMASGLPVVASDWSGYRDLVVHGETGFLVPTLWNGVAAEVLSWLAPIAENPVGEAYLARRTVVDVAHLTAYLRTLIENERVRKGLGAAGRTRVLHSFTWGGVIAKYRELWAEQIQISKSQRMKAGPRISLDFNRMFGHYASNQLYLSTAVKCSESGRVFATGETAKQRFDGLQNAGFGSDFVQEALRILHMCTQPATIQTIVDAGSPYGYEAAIWLLKKGLCELA